MRTVLRASLLLGIVALAGCESATDPLKPQAPSLSLAGGNKAAQVTGSGQITSGGEWRNFAITAQRSAGGTVTGQMQVNNRAQDRFFHGDVVCVGVFGNAAFIGVTITSSNDPNIVGANGILTVVDNGEGANASPDQISLFTYSYPLSTLQSWCAGSYGIPFQLGFLPLSPVEAGNIQVR